ncbi:hypothetical protein EJ02DRAFT_450687 [Clathrospora elynae]|uniref:Uncharacterized protein n=1 Tax=Clathrospora elynae TaxID=706981 RepID=A0A6A5T119_9PLEO|nr:hypothetical protein EJ02DRAFT_450687 [Clathrospora elynae]
MSSVPWETPSVPDPATESETTTPGKSNAELEAISAQNQLASPFFRLPAEVRNLIFHHAFGDNEIYAMPSGMCKFVCMGRPDNQFAWNLKSIAQIMALHLALICRQILFEVGPYLAFDSNSLGFTMPECFKLLMESLISEQKKRIEVVTFNHVYERG